MKIARMGSGNEIQHIQWLDISKKKFSFPTQKNTTNKNQISIATTYASNAKVNIDVANGSTNL